MLWGYNEPDVKGLYPVRWLFFKGIRNPKITVQSPILVPCSSVFLLTAEVEDGSFYKWEQTSGTPILIDSPNTQSTEVFRGATPGPFIFRLTVNNLSSALIEVFTTPTSTFEVGFASLSYEYLPNPIQGYIQPPPRSLQEGWGAVLSEPFRMEVIPPVFNLPHLIGYQVNQLVDGDWIDFGFWNPPYIDFIPGFRYEVIATYSIFGRPYSSRDEFEIGLTNLYRLGDDTIAPGFGAISNEEQFNKVSLEFLTKLLTSDLKPSYDSLVCEQAFTKIELSPIDLVETSTLELLWLGICVDLDVTKVDLSAGIVG
jgi:hypothetical protein